MAKATSLNRQSHLLGAKLRNLRKRHHLTLDDLSARCINNDPHSAPSVSYLSMIERGQRTPSEAMLQNLSEVLQKPPYWFLDDVPETSDIEPKKGLSGGLNGMVLEPNFLFTQDILQIAIPELLSQAGITGRQFAQLLIRAHQEHHHNHFPDLEKAADEVGKKQLFHTVDSLMEILGRLGTSIEWYEEASAEHGSILTSYCDSDTQIKLNQVLLKHEDRLKYDLAVHIGHRILHTQQGRYCKLYAGLTPASDNSSCAPSTQEILNAWQGFEASFFAGALLCPKTPFKQLLNSVRYRVDIHRQLKLSPSVVMRRMTAVSPYPYWHYFDAYEPGKLKAVYRGNGIPLPWGNMRQVSDPCQHWAVFRKFSEQESLGTAQLSILDVGGKPHLYCCESLKSTDVASQEHVLCAGIDINPAIIAQGYDADEVVGELKSICLRYQGSSVVPVHLKKILASVGTILNIEWIERGLSQPTRVICTRGSSCPRKPSCYA